MQKRLSTTALGYQRTDCECWLPLFEYIELGLSHHVLAKSKLCVLFHFYRITCAGSLFYHYPFAFISEFLRRLFANYYYEHIPISFNLSLRISLFSRRLCKPILLPQTSIHRFFFLSLLLQLSFNRKLLHPIKTHFIQVTLRLNASQLFTLLSERQNKNFA